MKKTIIIISALILGIIALLGIWFVYQSLTQENTSVDDFDSNTDSPFFPSGSTGGGEVDRSDDIVNGGSVPIQRIERFRRIHGEPVAGATFRTTTEGELIRFIERETGNVFEGALDSTQTTRLTNTTIPSIQEVYWGNNASSTVIRYITDDGDTVETFLGTIVPSTTESVGTLSGTFLENDISFLTMSPNTDKLFYMRTTGSGSTGVVHTFETNTFKTIFTTPLSELLPQWASNRTILLTTQPAHNIVGYTYRITDTGTSFSKVLGPVRGLTTLGNPSFSHVLYSQNGNLSVYTVAGETGSGLGLRTVPEKCVWSTLESAVVYCGVPKNASETTFPENWHKGIASTDDVVWKIHVIEGTSTVVFDPGSQGISVDIENLALSKDETHLLVHDRKTSTSYLLQLEL